MGWTESDTEHITAREKVSWYKSKDLLSCGFRSIFLFTGSVMDAHTSLIDTVPYFMSKYLL